jgi:hypothetical protein
MPSDMQTVSYCTLDDVREKHGDVVWLLYRASDRLSKWSWGHRWRDLPRRKPTLREWLDPQTGKPKPSWQDRATIIPMAVLTAFSLALAFAGPPILACMGALIALYSLLVDTINYYVRVLWFDDLAPGLLDSQRGVWSHRRILFLAILGYIQSILLFPAIYRAIPGTSGQAFPTLLCRSFFTATLFEIGKNPTFADGIQVLTSLFFITIVIAVISATGYERFELSRGGRK